MHKSTLVIFTLIIKKYILNEMYKSLNEQADAISSEKQYCLKLMWR